MTTCRAIAVGLTLATLALGCGCGGAPPAPSVDAAQLDAACADAHTTADATLAVDPGRIGMCDQDRVRPPAVGYSDDGCGSDADCVDGLNGRCNFGGHARAECSYDQCFSNADCPAGTRCACGVGPEDANYCLADYCCGCATADCGVSWACLGLGFPDALVCHTPADACRTDADCASGEFCTRNSQFSSDGPDPSWRCTAPWCAT